MAVSDAHILSLIGRPDILSAQPLLVELAERSSQPGAADYIDYFLTQPYTGGKIPHLLLLCADRVNSAAALKSSELLGAVLLHEYQIARVPLRVFVTEDYAGERNVLAPAPTRSAVALRAAAHLLQRGAHLAILSLQDAAFEQESPFRPGVPGATWSTARRTLHRRLPLAASYDATLATLGSHTRRNLRYYRRRAEDQLQCQFVAAAHIGEDQFVALNRMCAYPTPEFVAHWRYRTATSLPGGVFAGIRSASGDWLSLVGARRSHGTTWIDWQMNQTRYPSLSLSTVLRSYLIEHEIAAGSRTLVFEGGTPHSMQISFTPDYVLDLVVARNSIPAKLLRHLSGAVLPKKNFLAETVSRPDLIWRPW